MNKQDIQNSSSKKTDGTKKKELTTQPYKGARDIYPEEMRIQNYIFNIWRAICKRYGFQEYIFPILEPFEIFAAKTGEEIVNNQMFTLTDGAGRKLAIRPELTPGTVRMIAKKFYELEKPLKWFMIGNNWRYEKPQKGRGREFNQLEVNVFGVDDVVADFEIFQIIIALMKAFGAKKEQYALLYSDRKIIYALLRDFLKLSERKQTAIRSIMDKRAKVSKKDFDSMLQDVGIPKDEIDAIESFMNATLDSLEEVIPAAILKDNKGYQDLQKLTQMLKDYNLAQYCEFSPSIIRGFDYSDGIVYEVFDKNPKNNRSMFGGERFDGLIEIFGNYSLPATGFAMGDYTLVEFLKAWDLLPKLPIETKVLVTTFDKTTQKNSLEVAQKLREAEINTEVYFELKKLDKQLKYADRKNIPFVIIIGPEEIENNTIQLKNLQTKQQNEITIHEAIEQLRK